MGRPCKLTPELQKKVIDYIKMGNFETIAAQACGISESSYFNWKAMGEKASSGKYFKFLEAIKGAKAQAEMLHVARIMSAGTKSWQASAWYLERKHFERWGRKDFVGALGKDGRPVDPEPSPRVLLVPPMIDDIHEWADRAQNRVKKAADDRTSTDAS